MKTEHETGRRAEEGLVYVALQEGPEFVRSFSSDGYVVRPEDFRILQLGEYWKRIGQLEEDGPPDLTKIAKTSEELSELTGILASPDNSTIGGAVYRRDVLGGSYKRQLRSNLQKLYKASEDGTPTSALKRLVGDLFTAEDEMPKAQDWSGGELYSLTLPDTPWMLDGYLLQGGLNLLAGEVAVGKTFIALDLAIAGCVGGVAWQRRFTAPVTTLFLGLDNPFGVLAARLQGLARARGLGEADLERFHLWDQQLNLADPSDIAALGGQIRRTGAGLVVVDVLTRYVRGIDENAAGEVGPVFAGLRTLANGTGATFLVLHHLTKSKGLGAILDRVRGSGDIVASMDTALVLTVDNGIRKMAQKKNRLAAEVPAAQFDIVGEGGNFRLAFGDAAAMLAERAEKAILEIIQAKGTASGDEIEKVLRSDGIMPGHTKYQSLLESVRHDPSIGVTGQGKKGNPYRYSWKGSPDAVPVPFGPGTE